METCALHTHIPRPRWAVRRQRVSTRTPPTKLADSSLYGGPLRDFVSRGSFNQFYFFPLKPRASAGDVMGRYKLLQKAFMPRNPGEPPALWPIGTIVTSDDPPGLCWMPLDDDAAHAKTANLNQPSGPTQHVQKNILAKSLGASDDRLSDPDRVINDYVQTLRERLQKKEHGHDQ